MFYSFWVQSLISGAAISRSIRNSSSIQLVLHVIWYPPRHSHGVYTTCKFICWYKCINDSDMWWAVTQLKAILPIRCHLPTQLSSGRIIAITLLNITYEQINNEISFEQVRQTCTHPSKFALVHSATRSTFPLICMMSSQFSQPASLNCEAFCTISAKWVLCTHRSKTLLRAGNLLLQASIVSTPGVAFYRVVERWPS